MILSGLEIIKQIEEGGIEISPFNKENVNPNSYEPAGIPRDNKTGI